MKHKEKLYFPEWDDGYCSDIENLKLEAKEEGFTEFDAYEAVHDPYSMQLVRYSFQNFDA